MNEIVSPNKSEQSPEAAKVELTEWIVPPSPTEERKQIAQLFESFLVSKMQSGMIEVEPAKKIAERFVQIFQDATSNERLEKALEELHKQNDQLLEGFYLRVSELRLKPVRNKLYDFMIELVHLGKIKEARDLYTLYGSGKINDISDLLEVEKQMVGSKEISASAQKIADYLKSQNKVTEAEQLQAAIEAGAIKTLEDLKPWETMIINAPSLSPSSSSPPSSSPSSVPAQLIVPSTPASSQSSSSPSEMNFGQRVWEGLHRLDKQLRDMLGMK